MAVAEVRLLDLGWLDSDLSQDQVRFPSVTWSRQSGGRRPMAQQQAPGRTEGFSRD